MTIEELIDHEDKESKATWNGKPTLCAEEHRQLAEWLKDYKRLLEQEPCNDAISRANTIDEVSRIMLDHPLDGYEDGQLVLNTIQDMPPVTPVEKQEPCEDCISRQVAIDACLNGWNKDYKEIVEDIRALPPVTPAEKMGRWVLTQRDKYIDINCSECGHTRIKEYAYNYTVDEIDMQEIKDLVVTNKMNYCEYCGAKMGGEQE